MSKNMTAKEIGKVTKGIAKTLKELAPMLHDVAISAVKLHFGNGDTRPIQQLVTCLEENRAYRADMETWLRKYANVKIAGHKVTHNGDGKKELDAAFDDVPSFRAQADAKQAERKAKKEAEKLAAGTVATDETTQEITPSKTFQQKILSALEEAKDAEVKPEIIRAFLSKLLEDMAELEKAA